MNESILILLPVFGYNELWLKRQLNSISVQTYSDFLCIVSHDGHVSSDEADHIQMLLPDFRFQLVIQETRLGIYRHIEGLIKTYAFAHRYFVLCDQDDVWASEKLSKQVQGIEHCDATVVSVNAEIVDSLEMGIGGKNTFEWFGVDKTNNRLGLVLNQLTGASGIYRSQRLKKCLPFPRMVHEKVCVHDHWLYLCALVSGGISFDEECLWKYRQHNSNLIGAKAGGSHLKRLMRGLAKGWAILKARFIDRHDPVIQQGFVFQEALESRFSSKMLRAELILIGPSRDSDDLRFLLQNVFSSRLESLRLIISRNLLH